MEKPQLNKVSSSKYKGGIPEQIITLLNKQIELEAYSSQIYLQMGAWCDVQGLEGSAKYFKKHAEEERTHMLKLYEYFSDKNVVPTTPPIPAPMRDYTDINDVIETAVEHEFMITASYERACELALSVPCHQSFQLFQWFIKEQIEEEAVFTTIVDRYKLLTKYGITGAGILEFDEWLGDLA